MSLNTFIPGGAGLTYKYLAQIQSDLAKMEVSNQKFMQDLLTYAPEFLKASLDYTNQQASEQFEQGIYQACDEGAQGLITIGGALAGKFGVSDPTSEPELKVSAVEDNSEIEMADLSGDLESAGPASTDGSETDEAKLEGETTKSPAATEKTTEEQSAESTKADQEKLQKAIDEANAKRNFIYNVVTPGAQHAAAAGFKVPEGLKQADATQDQGLAQYVQGLGGMINQIEQTTSSVIGSEAGQEQAAAQALQTVSQLSGPV